MRRLFYGVLWVWVCAIRVKRFFFPRPFRVVLIRKRCFICKRRLRPTLKPRRLLTHDDALPDMCKKCFKGFHPVRVRQ